MSEFRIDASGIMGHQINDGSRIRHVLNRDVTLTLVNTRDPNDRQVYVCRDSDYKPNQILANIPVDAITVKEYKERGYRSV